MASSVPFNTLMTCPCQGHDAKATMPTLSITSTFTTAEGTASGSIRETESCYSVISFPGIVAGRPYAPPAHDIGHLGAAHAGRVLVDQIGPHLAFPHLITPIPDMLEHRQDPIEFRAG